MGEFLEFLGISFGFPFFVYQPSPRDRKVYDNSRWRHISFVRPTAVLVPRQCHSGSSYLSKGFLLITVVNHASWVAFGDISHQD